jgi:hypothetical protein
MSSRSLPLESLALNLLLSFWARYSLIFPFFLFGLVLSARLTSSSALGELSFFLLLSVVSRFSSFAGSVTSLGFPSESEELSLLLLCARFLDGFCFDDIHSY